MRGLAFPPTAAPLPREPSESFDYGTPMSSTIDDPPSIPIDPVLASPPIDPALLSGPGVPPPGDALFPLTRPPSQQQHGALGPPSSSTPTTACSSALALPLPLPPLQSFPLSHPLSPASAASLSPLPLPPRPTRAESEPALLSFPREQLAGPGAAPRPAGAYALRQYSQGPQGDPFAQQVSESYLAARALEEAQAAAAAAAATLTPTQPAKKRKRRAAPREEECGFCGGSARNKRGKDEGMIKCHECGRSGHPSCMQLEKLADVVRSYDWKCIECKNCEVCREKGDDERILFCDCCDRGWHMECVDPPIQTAPEGDWRCPFCVADPPEARFAQYQYQGHENENDSEALHMSDMNLRSSARPSTATAPSIRGDSVASTSRSAGDVLTAATARPKRIRKSAAGTSIKARTRGTSKGAAGASGPTDNEDGSEDGAPPARRPRTSRPSAKARAARQPTVSSEAEAEEEVEEDESPSKNRPTGRARTAAATAAAAAARRKLRVAPPATSVSARTGKGKARDEDEAASPQGLFDDFLNPADRDTSKTTPTAADKLVFERSRIAAEAQLAPPPPPPPPPASASRHAPREHLTPVMTSARPLRSAVLSQLTAVSTPRGSASVAAMSPAPSTPGPPTLSKFEAGVLRIQRIRFGPYDIRTWYDAPFPEEYATIPDGRLWICEFCLKYMKSRYKAIRHLKKCKMRHPPGDEIYRDGAVSIFEVDGRRNKIYCQNLCLLSKMFLDHKSLFYDVEPFLFYVITEVDEFGAHFVGYFSKEKRCPKDYNLSCIMTLPVRQRQGWGNLLIDFSYLLSKIEQRIGSPEKPLSSLGALGYKNYWTLAVMRFLEHAPDDVRLEEISSATSMTTEDVCVTLMQQNMIYIRDATPPAVRPSPGQSIRFPKGRKNGVGRKQLQRMQDGGEGERSPFVVPAHYEIRFDRGRAAAYVRAWEAKGYLRLKPEKLQWTPYVMARGEQQQAAAVAAMPLPLPTREVPVPATPIAVDPVTPLRRKVAASGRQLRSATRAEIKEESGSEDAEGSIDMMCL